jgi:hypothetical protein
VCMCSYAWVNLLIQLYLLERKFYWSVSQLNISIIPQLQIPKVGLCVVGVTVLLVTAIFWEAECNIFIPTSSLASIFTGGMYLYFLSPALMRCWSTWVPIKAKIINHLALGHCE